MKSIFFSDFKKLAATETSKHRKYPEVKPMDLSSYYAIFFSMSASSAGVLILAIFQRSSESRI